MEIKVSPYHILSYLWRFSLFFISLPVQTLVLLSFPDYDMGFFVLIADILLILFFAISACVHFQRIKVYVLEDRIHINQGIVFRHTLTLHTKSTDSINITQGVLRKLTGVYKVTVVCTDSEAVLYLNFQSKQKFLDALKYTVCETPVYKAGFLSALIMSAGFHNSLSGALSLIPLLKSIGTVTDSGIIFGAIESADFFTYLMPRISPALFTLAVLIFSLWIVGGITTLVRFFPLNIHFSEKSVTIHRGFLLSRCHKIQKSDIRSIVVRKSIMLIMLGKCYAELLFSSEKGENRLPFICADTPLNCTRVTSRLGFKLNACNSPLKPHPNALWGYTWLPMSFLLGISLAIIFTDTLTPYTLYPHAGVFIILWLSGWFFLRVYAFNYSSLNSDKSLLHIKSFSGLSLTDAVIPHNMVRGVKISQTVFQKRYDTCSVRIYIKNRKRKSFFIKHTDNKKTAELVEKFCGNNPY